MHRRMSRPRGLKLRCYTVCMIDINQYLDAFHRAKASDNIEKNKLNEILLKSMPNGWSKQACIHYFDCKNINLKYINMFECMGIAETIYEYCV